MSASATPPRTRVIVTDANVVINFVHVGLLGELPAMVDMECCISDEVYDEVLRPAQRTVLDAALGAGMWSRESLTDPGAIELFATLATIMGRGEAASLALAVSRRSYVASDERRVFLREARQRLGEGRVVDTPGLLVMAIRRGTLTVDDADRAKAILETHRFTMRFHSFADLITGPHGGPTGR
jgi:predicted nucleic acid-binding protein